MATELSGADSDDVKALGFLAFDLAGAALTIQQHMSLNRYWWATSSGLAVSAILLVCSLWRRKFETGPVAKEFFDSAAASADAEFVHLLAMQAVTAARDHNEEVRKGKARWYTASLAMLGVTVVGSGIFLWLVH